MGIMCVHVLFLAESEHTEQGWILRETWFLVGHPRTDSSLPEETHFAPKGEINTATNLDSPFSPTHSYSPLSDSFSTCTNIFKPSKPVLPLKGMKAFSLHFKLMFLCRLYVLDTFFLPAGWDLTLTLSNQVTISKHLACWSVLEQDMISLQFWGWKADREFSWRIEFQIIIIIIHL